MININPKSQKYMKDLLDLKEKIISTKGDSVLMSKDLALSLVQIIINNNIDIEVIAKEMLQKEIVLH